MQPFDQESGALTNKLFRLPGLIYSFARQVDGNVAPATVVSQRAGPPPHLDQTAVSELDYDDYHYRLLAATFRDSQLRIFVAAKSTSAAANLLAAKNRRYGVLPLQNQS